MYASRSDLAQNDESRAGGLRAGEARTWGASVSRTSVRLCVVPSELPLLFLFQSSVMFWNARSREVDAWKR